MQFTLAIHRCPSGWTQIETRATNCVSCAVGKYEIGDKLTCTSCPQAYYQNEVATTSCIICPSGWKQQNTRATSCTACSAGKHESGDLLSCKWFKSVDIYFLQCTPRLIFLLFLFLLFRFLLFFFHFLRLFIGRHGMYCKVFSR